MTDPQPSEKRRARRRRAQAGVVAIGGVSLVVILMAILVGPDRVMDGVAEAAVWIETHQLQAWLIFAAWAFASQLVLAPTGTLSLLAGGVLIGWPAGVVYWLMMMLTGWMVQRQARIGFAAQARRGVAKLERWLKSPARGLAGAARREGVLLTAALRLAPVLPSAGAALAAGSLGVSARAFLIGTALAGWVRPLAFASAGAALGGIADASATDAALAGGLGIALTALAFLAPGVLAVRLFRRLSPRAVTPGL